ncbi:hypothetical protein EV700_1996 [Fluviicoccus keumensis]|uniref:Uncharacterized protein n=1 Tax=Fluviicoccus keumensis TaxID=1435465 RepID=A0A4Q7Z5Q4_9GAMM|nr:hypothetical protein [Fluviicoccus keumensis]RZU45181.1 hypothetical protein EV700_1996 [Fluviicoccus keumensis]
MSRENPSRFGLEELSYSELQDIIVEAREMIGLKQQAEIRKAYIDALQAASRVGLGIDELIAWGRKDHRKRGSNK